MNGISTTSEGAVEEWAIPKISSILFDMDGVLINSEPLHEFTLLELSERFGRRFESEAELQQFKGLPEASITRLIRESFPEVRLTNDEITDLRIGSILANFHVVQMIEGALEFVKRCQAAGFQLGLTTSASGVVYGQGSGECGCRFGLCVLWQLGKQGV
jgi:beta-phosphoglucomutase-like phosphatase (HAD superfamily)